jgi:hypothetical protein
VECSYKLPLPKLLHCLSGIKLEHAYDWLILSGVSTVLIVSTENVFFFYFCLIKFDTKRKEHQNIRQFELYSGSTLISCKSDSLVFRCPCYYLTVPLWCLMCLIFSNLLTYHTALLMLRYIRFFKYFIFYVFVFVHYSVCFQKPYFCLLLNQFILCTEFEILDLCRHLKFEVFFLTKFSMTIDLGHI